MGRFNSTESIPCIRKTVEQVPDGQLLMDVATVFFQGKTATSLPPLYQMLHEGALVVNI